MLNGLGFAEKARKEKCDGQKTCQILQVTKEGYLWGKENWYSENTTSWEKKCTHGHRHGSGAKVWIQLMRELILSLLQAGKVQVISFFSIWGIFWSYIYDNGFLMNFCSSLDILLSLVKKKKKKKNWGLMGFTFCILIHFLEVEI